jgi:hypothetical protein
MSVEKRAAMLVAMRAEVMAERMVLQTAVKMAASMAETWVHLMAD